MRRVLPAFVLLAAGIALGLASAWWAVKRLEGLGAAPAGGPWRTSALAGSGEADLHTRAAVALGGLLALSRKETLYYVARRDSAGSLLRSRCRYRVSGGAPAARWWSVTAYTEDLFLFAEAGGRHSVGSTTLPLDDAGRFAFATGPAAPGVGALPWLPTPGDRGLVLALRLYRPGGADFDPPRIDLIGPCP
jgi:hypothetical protein